MNRVSMTDTCGCYVAGHAHLTSDVAVGTVESERAEVDVFHDVTDAVVHRGFV